MEYKSLLTLVERKTLKIVGANCILGADNDYILIDTSDGKLTVRGKHLTITDLSKSNNTIEVVGIIDEVEFDEKKKGFWG